MNFGVKSVIGFDRSGAIYEGRTEGMNPAKEWFAQHTNREGFDGSLTDAMKGADLFLGLSGPRTVTPEQVGGAVRRYRHDPSRPVVLFTEALTHCTIPWRGASTRRTLLYKYAPGHLAWGKNYGADLADLAGSGVLTPRQQILMDPPSVSPRQSLRPFSTASR